jgi:hypothetical protein
VLALLSGGLDSLLTVRLLESAGVEFECVHFRTGFVKADRDSVVGRMIDDRDGPAVRVVDVVEEYVREAVLRPKHGYGSGMNPCIDCRAFLLARADRIAGEERFDLLATGEVVGQRALDQSHDAIGKAERDAGVAGRVFRPLCARHVSQPRDADGIVQLDGLPEIRGGARRGLFERARRLGVKEYPVPSGGCCRLADPRYARRLRDYLSHVASEEIDPAGIELLSVGRHFRIAWNATLVVGRREEECEALLERSEGCRVVRAADGRGALGLVRGDPDTAALATAAAITLRYSPHRSLEEVDAVVRDGDRSATIRVAPAPDDLVDRHRL